MRRLVQWDLYGSLSGIRDVRCYTTDDQTGTRRLVRDPEPAVEKKFSLCKSAQYLWSSRKMVWRFWYEVWWNASENYTWEDIERSSTKRSDFSLVKAPRNAPPAAGHSLREVQQSFETLGTEVQFTSFFEEAAFHPWSCCRNILQNSLRCGWWCRRSNSCMQRECTSFRADSGSRTFASTKQRTIFGPVLQVNIMKCLGIWEIEIQIPSTISPKNTSPSQHPVPPVRNYDEREEREAAKETESSAAEMSHSHIEETHALFQWSLCHWDSPHFLPLERLIRAKLCGTIKV